MLREKRITYIEKYKNQENDYIIIVLAEKHLFFLLNNTIVYLIYLQINKSFVYYFNGVLRYTL